MLFILHDLHHGSKRPRQGLSGSVCDPQGIFFVNKSDHAQHGSEDFFLRDAHLWLHDIAMLATFDVAQYSVICSAHLALVRARTPKKHCEQQLSCHSRRTRYWRSLLPPAQGSAASGCSQPRQSIAGREKLHVQGHIVDPDSTPIQFT